MMVNLRNLRRKFWMVCSQRQTTSLRTLISYWANYSDLRQIMPKRMVHLTHGGSLETYALYLKIMLAHRTNQY